MKRPAGFKLKLWTALWLAGASVLAHAQSAAASKPSIYVCIDAKGRRITSDRPIAECLDRDQRLLNPDGSVRGVRGRYMSPAEHAAREDALRRKKLEEAAKMDAVRRDRNLLARYPDKASHDKARDAALDDVRTSIQVSQNRLLDLKRERKPLLAEAEFYTGKPLPAKLKRELDDNEASAEAQKTLIQNQQVELRRVTALYDAELARLERLWAGAPAGSLDDKDSQAASAATPRAASDNSVHSK